jgi:hypothetical protein
MIPKFNCKDFQSWVGLIAVVITLFPLQVLAGANGSDILGRYIPLNILWQCNNGSDSFTTISSAEAEDYSVDGQLAYIPANPISGMPNAAFYRLYNESSDHMDSIYTNEGGYTLELTLGYPWTNATAVSGLSPLTRWRDTTNGDHATLIGAETLDGYTEEAGLGRYGFARYGNASEELLNYPTSGTLGGVSVQSNALAGGALWQWTWNGTQFINHNDLGRELQTSVAQVLDANGDTSPQAPTEAGDEYPLYPDPAFSHGSVCTTLSNSSGNVSQTTRCIPLEWNDTGGDPDQASLDLDVILGKDLYLNYTMPDGKNRNWPVAKYVSYISIPNSVQTRATEIPTAYLPGTFNRFYTYNAGAPGAPGTLVEVTSQVPDGTVNPGYAYYFQPASLYGGVIISDSTGTKAMGLYAAMTTAPYPGGATMFGLWKFLFSSDKTLSTTSAACTKMSVFHGINAQNQGTATLKAGVNQFNTWVMTDTVANITADMDILHSQAAQGVY